MNKINITLKDNTTTCSTGTPVADLLTESTDSNGLPFIAALVNNNVASLSYPLAVNSTIEFISAANPHGWRIYRNSLCFLLGKAVNDIFPNAEFAIEHSFGDGLFCSINIDGNHKISKDQLQKIEERMRELVDADAPIERRKISFTDAIEIFESCGMPEEMNLLRYRNPPHIVLNLCDKFWAIAHNPLVQRTGVLKDFKLIHYPPGFVLQLPQQANPTAVPEFKDQPHLFNIFQEHKKWGRILNVTTVGKLNQITANGKISDFIRTAEALHNKKLSNIADAIASRSDELRVVLIAGPSSAGKTTFSKRLATHLHVNGLQPVTISTDDYFVGEANNPLDENGKPDYEHIEAVDIKGFNHDIMQLINGDPIPVRRFNFEKKCPEFLKEQIQLKPNQILVIEGIHGLNPRLTEAIPAQRKFKIYVSALTQLNLDSNNRISTTDNRLLRRMVRDHQFRGHSAIDTIRMWPMVRRGEQRWVFPFQKEADATFNSALDYELAVLKPFVEPLLMQIKPSDPEYAESRRLTGFLMNFLAVPQTVVPNDSILREYIGGSVLEY
jgi:uridine kinase